MVKISSRCSSSSNNTSKVTAVTHIKTEPCAIEVTLNNVDTHQQLVYSCDGAPNLVSDNISAEHHQVKQEPSHSETDFMQPGNGNVQPQSIDSRVSTETKTEPECAQGHSSCGVKTEPEIHDVVNFPLKEEKDDVEIKLETGEEERDEGAGNSNTLKPFRGQSDHADHLNGTDLSFLTF